MTSPPTSRGWHRDDSSWPPQTWQDSSVSSPGEMSCGRARRTAKQARGCALRNRSARSLPSGGGVVAWSRLALLFRLRMVVTVPGMRSLEMPLEQLVGLVLVLGHLQCFVQVTLGTVVAAFGSPSVRHGVQGVAEVAQLVCASWVEPLVEVARRRSRRRSVSSCARVAPHS